VVSRLGRKVESSCSSGPGAVPNQRRRAATTAPSPEHPRRSPTPTRTCPSDCSCPQGREVLHLLRQPSNKVIGVEEADFGEGRVRRGRSRRRTPSWDAAGRGRRPHDQAAPAGRPRRPHANTPARPPMPPRASRPSPSAVHPTGPVSSRSDSAPQWSDPGRLRCPSQKLSSGSTTCRRGPGGRDPARGCAEVTGPVGEAEIFAAARLLSR
jgi:hypothetical protein